MNSFLKLKQKHFYKSLTDHIEIPAMVSLRQAFSGHGLDGYPDSFYREALDAFFQYERTQWYPYSKALTVLKQLRSKGLRTGIFSNASDDKLIQQLVDDFGFRPYADPVLTSPGTGVCKPDIRAFLPFLENWSLPAGAVVMVGDRLDADIAGGKNAGMKTVLYQLDQERLDKRDLYTDETKAVGIEPDAVIRNLTELPDCLESFI